MKKLKIKVVENLLVFRSLPEAPKTGAANVEELAKELAPPGGGAIPDPPGGAVTPKVGRTGANI